MQGRKYIFVILALVVVAASITGTLAGKRVLSAKPPASESINGSITDIGFTYLPVKDQNACCYGLKPVNGALVTGVNKDGLADRAGLKPGDLIVGLNGVYLDANTPLLGLIRDCPPESDITVEIQDADAERIITVASAK